MTKESAVKRRSNGQFAKGNKEGKKFEPKNNANVTNREKMIHKAYQMAHRGSISAMHYLSDRGEGKVKEIQEITHKDSLIIE
jgi:hypothetical protein